MTPIPRYLASMWAIGQPVRRGPRPAFDIGDIGAAAVALADSEGISAVSMKSVAASLGYTPMSLYRYLDSKDDLVTVMLDVAIGPPPDDYPAQGWRRRLDTWVRDLAARRSAHPWILDTLPGSPPLTPNFTRWTEHGLAALDDTPLRLSERLSMLLAADGWATYHQRWSLHTGMIGVPDPASAQAGYGRQLAELIDPERFPLLTAARPQTFDDATDFYADEFNRGLALILDGIAAAITRAGELR